MFLSPAYSLQKDNYFSVLHQYIFYGIFIHIGNNKRGDYLARINDWISQLKMFQPKIISLYEKQINSKKIEYISNELSLTEECIYVGKISQVMYHMHLIEHAILFLILDENINLEHFPTGNNTIIVFKEKIEIEDLYKHCQKILLIQEDIKEKTSILMEEYLMDSSIPNILNKISEIINNPVMVIDGSYRVMFYSDMECDDIQWKQSIAYGCCSYEFISQFIQLYELPSIQQENNTFFAGCLVSPMRRAISKINVNQKKVGYLLSIESSNPFDEITIKILEVASKLLARELTYFALESGKDLYHSVWDYLNFAIEKREGSVEVLKDHLHDSGLSTQGHYYLLLVNLKNYKILNENINFISQAMHELFAKCISSYYDGNVIILVESSDSLTEIKEKINTKKSFIIGGKLKVIVSDGFEEIGEISRYYQQTLHTLDILDQLSLPKVICLYDDVRMYDIIFSQPSKEKYPLFIGEKQIKIYEYDKEHDTEFWETIYSYIMNSRSLSYTANDLHVHKNTVSYRIGRVKELFDIDLNHAQTRIDFCMGYHAMKLIEEGV